VTQFVLIFIFALAAFLLWQSVMTLGFIRKLNTWNPARLEDADCPRAAVILCLRGKDPFLDHCIESLLCQDYPDYQLHVIVDHESDPARSVVVECGERLDAKHLRVEILEARREDCSLKCSSLLQALRSVENACDVVALVDADTAPHPTWLRELVSPLRDNDVGAATGNRWYMPATPSLGATIRYFWNTFAIVQMVALRIAWGGSLAVKMDVVRDADLLEAWGRAFCEDTMLYSKLRKRGLRLVFVPSLIMVNREDCGIGDYVRWVARQLLTARLYHPHWIAVVLHGVGSTVLPLAVLAMCVAAASAGQWAVIGWILSATLVYGVSLLVLWWPLEASVRRIVAKRGEPVGWMSWTFFRSCLGALPLLQVLYPRALLSTLLMRRVAWRGVEYRVDGPWRIRLIKYLPFQKSDDKATISL